MKFSEHHFFARDMKRDYLLAVKGEGVWVWDEQGNKYLDACAGANVSGIGHGVVEIASAMADQARAIAYVPPQHFLNRPTIDLCQKLIDYAPEGYSRVMLLSGGSEAMENALKIARQYHVYRGAHSRYRVVSRWQGFHGNTLAADAISGKTDRRTIQMPMLIDTSHIVAAGCYRCAFEKTYPECGVLCARDLERTLIQEGPEYVSAFTSETIVGAAAAAVVPVDEYYGIIRDTCDRHEVVWIADEIMTGAGRTGTFTAIEQWGVLPDLLVLAKGLSAGYAPLAAILVHDRIAKVFEDTNRPYIGGHTYNAHPVTAAAGLRVLEYMEKNRLIEKVSDKAQRLGDGLQAIGRNQPLVGEVRGKGLMWGMEFVQDKRSKKPFDRDVRFYNQVVMKALDRGLIVYPVSGCVDGDRGDGILICPPLVISEPEIDDLLYRLEKTLTEITSEVGAVI